MSNRELIEQYINKFYKNIMMYCMRQLGYTADAEDVCQEVFIDFARKFHTFDNHNYISHWLYKAAKYSCMMYRKKQMQQANRIIYIDDENIDGGNLLYDEDHALALIDEHHITDEDIEQAAVLILSTLTPSERALYNMVYVDRLPRPDICRDLKINDTVLRKRVQRIKEKILENKKKICHNW